jgi:hypothetical protein
LGDVSLLLRKALRRVLDDLDDWFQLVPLEFLFGIPVLGEEVDSTGISLWRMPLHRVLVDVGAPAGFGRHDQLAVLYARRIGDEEQVEVATAYPAQFWRLCELVASQH